MGKSGCGRKEPGAVVVCEGAGVGERIPGPPANAFCSGPLRGQVDAARGLGYGHLQSSMNKSGESNTATRRPSAEQIMVLVELGGA